MLYELVRVENDLKKIEDTRTIFFLWLMLISPDFRFTVAFKKIASNLINLNLHAIIFSYINGGVNL